MAEGLSQQEFDDIHQAVEEAMAYVALPVTFHKANPESVDDLYREGPKGSDGWEPLAPIRASIRYKPDEHILTRVGAREDSEILLFIPRQHILNWEDAEAAEFEITEDMELECQYGRFQVSEPTRTDALPVGEGATSDYIGMIVCGTSARP